MADTNRGCIDHRQWRCRFRQQVYALGNLSRTEQSDSHHIALSNRGRIGVLRGRDRRRRSGYEQGCEQRQSRQSLGVEQRQQKQAAYGERLHNKRNQSCPAAVRTIRPSGIAEGIGKHSVLFNVSTAMFMDTSEYALGQGFRLSVGKEKSRVKMRLVETSSPFKVSYSASSNYFG